MGNETYVDGGLFREARERAGLSLGELAQALDVREEYLEALERGELGRLIGPSYMQSIAVRYAAGVNLDPEKVLGASDEVPQPQSPQDDRRGAGRELEGRRSPRRRMSVRRSLLIALVLIGVAVATVAVLQSMSVISLSEALSGSAGRTATTAGVPTTAGMPTTASTTTTTASMITTASTGSTTTTGVTATTKTEAFTVVFNPSADVWLEIADEKTGKAIYSGIRKAGERLEQKFTAPAKVVVGKPKVIKVSFNGRVVKTPTTLVWRLSSAGIAPAQ
jgi:cytoskeleton protein RodZ